MKTGKPCSFRKINQNQILPDHAQFPLELQDLAAQASTQSRNAILQNLPNNTARGKILPLSEKASTPSEGS
jgi:hypothetical protein